MHLYTKVLLVAYVTAHSCVVGQLDFIIRMLQHTTTFIDLNFLKLTFFSILSIACRCVVVSIAVCQSFY